MIQILSIFLASGTYLPLLTTGTVVLKLALFIKSRTENWKWSHFVYFDDDHIMSSSNMENREAKKVQNYLTNMILILALLYTVVKILEKFFIF